MTEADDAIVVALGGDTAATRDVIEHLRRTHDLDVAGATARIMLAEGIMHAYDDKLVESKDRLRRASTVATMQRDPEAACAANAWLSFIEYNHGELIDAARRACAVIDESRGVFVHADWRAASVLAALFQLANDRLHANGWFTFARQRAAQSVDTNMMAAAIFSMAVTRLGSSRFAAICAGAELPESDLLFLRSSAAYDRRSGSAVQTYFHALHRGLAHAMVDEHAAAIEAFAAYDAQRPATDIDPVMHAERGWCRSRLGDAAGAMEDAAVAAQHIGRLVDDDDVAIAHRRLSAIHDAAGDAAASRRHLELSQAAANRFIQCTRDAHAYLLSARPTP